MVGESLGSLSKIKFERQLWINWHPCKFLVIFNFLQVGQMQEKKAEHDKLSKNITAAVSPFRSHTVKLFCDDCVLDSSSEELAVKLSRNRTQAEDL